MHMHNRMNLDNRTTLVLTNAGRVFNFFVNTHQFWVFEQIQSVSKNCWFWVFENFQNQRTTNPEFSDSKNFGY
jgi:hypothetical protein